MKIVVTGGSGRIGQAVVQAMGVAGHDVLSLDRIPPEDPSVPHRVIDLRDADAVQAAFDGAATVCHLGEIPNIIRGDRAGCYATNTAIGATVMESAANAGVSKLIYTSTCQVYGCWGSENGSLADPVYLPLDENHPLQPRNAYALSKVANETYARLLAERTGMSVAAFRFPGVMTAEMWEDRVSHARPRASNKPRRPDGFGTYLHVDDASAAYMRAVEASWAGFEAFHFVADTVRSSQPIRAALLERYPKTPLPEDWPDFAAPVSTDKARRILGWRPVHAMPIRVAQVA
jgi:nucleoside-diphosphate-sugar epimerase